MCVCVSVSVRKGWWIPSGWCVNDSGGYVRSHSGARSGQSDRRSGQQSVTLNTSPWHRADTLCHRPTHCLSTLFTRTHASARREQEVCERLSVNTPHTDHLSVCKRATERDKNIKRNRKWKEGRERWGVCLPANLSMSHKKWLLLSTT